MATPPAFDDAAQISYTLSIAATVTATLWTADGRQLTGLIAAETATSITLRRADNATDTVLRIDIEQLKSTGMSLMPEGLEKQIDQQSMADLLEFLKTAE